MFIVNEGKLIMIILFLIFIILPIFVSIKLFLDKKNQRVFCEFKLFIFTLFKCEIKIKEKIIKILIPKEKSIKFNEVKLSKQKNTWILKSFRCIKSFVELNVNFIEFSQNPKETCALIGVISSLVVLQKNIFKKSKNKIVISNYPAIVKIRAIFYTNIILMITEWIKYLIKNKKGVNNANTKLYTKSN